MSEIWMSYRRFIPLDLIFFFMPNVNFTRRATEPKIGMLPVVLQHLNLIIPFVIPYSLALYQPLIKEWSYDLLSTKIPPNHPINHAHSSNRSKSSRNQKFNVATQPPKFIQENLKIKQLTIKIVLKYPFYYYYIHFIDP